MKIQLRHDTAAHWTAANPVLDKGEFGAEDDTALFKKGDGVTAWNDLAYANNGTGMTQSAADARYIKLAQINAANGVAGLDANIAMDETQLPLPPVTLTVLLANKLA